MALEDILKRIASDGRRESNKLEREAKAQARQILADAKRKAASVREKILRTAEADAQKERKRVLALAKLRARNIVLERKQKVLKQAFDVALDRLLTLSQERYLSLIKSMLLATVESGSEEVIVSSNDRERIGKLLEEVNSELAAEGKKGNLKLSRETREGIKGGFILKSGKIEENNSFSSLLGALRDELELELFKVLSPAKEEKTRPKGV